MWPSDGLRLWRGAFRTAVAVGHEFVEFGLVLGMAQAVEKLHEFALLFFQPAQGLGAVLVKGAVAGRLAVAGAGSAAAPALGRSLHSRHPPLPARPGAICPACHSPTPY